MGNVIDHRMIKGLAEGLKPVISDAFQKAVAPLMERIAELEARQPIKGEKGDIGDRGEAGPQGEPGVAGPAGERGEKGDPGERGETGPQGEPGAPGEAGAQGASGERGERGEKGDIGERGEKGDPGLNGKDADPLLIERMVDDVVAKIPPAPAGRDGQPGIPGRDGKDGLNGKDGLGPEDIEEEYQEDGRILVRRYIRDGVVVKELRHKTITPLDRGVWRAGPFLKGDSVSYRGSIFIAQEDTSDEPETSKAWRLAVKRGRDGKDGVMKPAPELKPIALK